MCRRVNQRSTSSYIFSSEKLGGKIVYFSPEFVKATLKHANTVFLYNRSECINKKLNNFKA